jgi:hypothetical protein
MASDMSGVVWEYEHSIEGSVSRSAIWGLYSDVSAWPQWDRGIEWIKLDGGFEEGVSGTIKPKDQDPLPFRLTRVSVNSGFSDETVVPGAGITIGFTHTLESVGEGLTRITHRVSISGPSGESLGPEFGRGITDGIPDTMRSLLTLAQRQT